MRRKIEGTPWSNLKFDEMSAWLLSFARNSKLALIAHARPDGDCIGSAFAMALLLEAIGCKTRVICSDPLPERLAFLNLTKQEDLSMPPLGEDFSEGFDAIALDVAAPSQLGMLEGRYNILLGLDHHANSTPISDRYMDADASATGEIVWRIARNWQRTGVISEIPDGVAYACYAAISSDTGCFRYSNVTSSTHRIAAQLLSLVPAHADVDRRLFEIKTPSRIAAEKAAVDVLKVVDNGRISVCAMSAKEICNAGIRRDELDALTDVARSVDGIRVASSVREERPGEYRVSLRSNSDTDVSEICADFGGGGHVRAAGCTIHACSLDEAVRVLTGAISKRINAS